MQPQVPNPLRKLACARCGAAFECGLSADCWCAAEPYALPMPASPAEDCLCPGCLRKVGEALAGKTAPRL
jgi:cysteine-rich CWC protein